MSFHNEENKLDWMYKSSTTLVDREEYLLGRKIDKTLELLDAEEKQNELGITQPKNHVEHECIPPSIRDYNKIQVGEQQVDLATKLQEDPLVAIKKREEETRKQFLQNPIQLKKLQSTLDRQLRKKRKKSKKHKNSDIDSLIAEKLQSLKDSSVDISLFADSTSVTNERKLNKKLLKKFRKYKRHLTEKDFHEILENKKSKTIDDEATSKESDSEDNSNYIPRKKLNYERQESNQNRDYNKFKKQSYQERKPTPFLGNRSGHLTEEEKEQRRKEMMRNAAWRDVERTNNVKKYRDEDAKETKIQKDYNPDFIHKELMKSANSGTVESRIRSNINSIQRSKGDMNKHFSKRM